MSLTAFLPTGAPQVLPFIGTPGAGTVGHALVWSQSPQGFTLSPIAVGPDQFSGVLPVAKGGWGTNTGSFTSPGAITLTAGGESQGISLNPSGTGSGTGDVQINGYLNLNVPSHQASFRGVRLNLATGSNYSNGINLIKGEGFASLFNFTSNPTGFTPGFQGRSTMAQPSFKFVGNQNTQLADSILGVINFDSRNTTDTGYLEDSLRSVVFSNLESPRWTMLGNGDITQVGTLTISATTESTSTTTGALRVDGGLGVAKNANIGGNLKVSGTTINFANLPTSSASLAVGDLWRDGEIVKVKL